jgi:hypothetical protein
LTVQGVRIRDRKLARDITELVRDTESPLLFKRGKFCSVIRRSAWPS